jgi:hypothetical protein
MTERRSRRSHVHAEALALFLEQERRRLRVKSLVVTTRAGRLLGAAGAPTAGSKGRKASSLATWELRAGALDVVVVSHGGRLSYELGSGVKRILTS